MRHATNEIICDDQKRSGLAKKITKIIEIWIKRSVKVSELRLRALYDLYC